MEISLQEIAETFGIQDRIVEIEDEAIRKLLGGVYLKGREAILFSGSFKGPDAILLGLEFIGLNDDVILNFSTVFFDGKGKINRFQTRRIEPSCWFCKSGKHIDFVKEIGEEFDIIRLWPDGSSKSSNSKDFRSLIGGA